MHVVDTTTRYLKIAHGYGCDCFLIDSAGIANILFATPATVVYEMHNFGVQRMGYARLCAALGSPYFYSVAEEKNRYPCATHYILYYSLVRLARAMHKW